MPELKNLKFEKAGGVAKITLARPKHNVLNLEMTDLTGARIDYQFDKATIKVK